MLSKRLRSRELFKDEVVLDAEKEVRALNILEDCVHNLVLAMRTIESMKLMDTEDIEDYVIAYLEACEERYFLMSDTKYERFISDYLR